MTATFVNSGVDGAGFQGFVAASPAGDGTVISCADVAGIHRSTDWGETWTTVVGWAYNTNHLKVAGCVFSVADPDIVVIFTGDQGTSQNGGVWISTDNGATFTQETSSPTFAGGNNSQAGLPSTHPRSTGRVGVIDYTNDLLYVGSYDDGVYRADFDPATGTCGSFTSIGSMSGKFIRSIAVDETGDQLFVACHDEVTAGDDGVFLITSASSSPSSGSKIGGAPVNAEELLYLDGRVYAVCGGPTTRGVFSCTASSPSTWTERSGGLPVSTPGWQAMDGWVDGSGNHVLYVGCDSPTSGTPSGGGTAGNSIYRCDDGRSGSPTWTTLTLLSDANTPREPLGQVDEWWLAADSEFLMVNRTGFDCASVAIGQIGGTGTPDYLFASGRAGVWRCDAPTASGSGLNDQWHPAVDGLAVTINRCVTADPTRDGTAAVGNVDYDCLITDDHGATVVQDSPPIGTACYTIAHDPTSGYLVVGTADRDDNDLGQVYTKSTPAAAWATTSLQADGGTARVLGVAAATVGSDLVLLAARMEEGTGGSLPANVTDCGGLWRKVGSAAWAQILSPSVNGVMDNQTSKEAPFTWPDQGTATNQTIYWYERANGVWRSTTSGASWVRIWATTSNAERTGYVAADPTDVERLYISQGGDLYRVNNAGSVAANSASPTDITPSTTSGRISAICCDYRGWIWACANRTSSQQAGLWVSDDTGSSWTNVADDTYRQTAIQPYNLTVAVDDAVYIALNGNGVLTSDGISSDVLATAAAAGTGAVTTAPTVTTVPTAAAAGSGTVTSAPAVTVTPTAGFAGTGSLTQTGVEEDSTVATTISGVSRERGSACPALDELVSLPPYGSGGEGIAPIEGSATFAGAGATAADGQITLDPTATFVGAGQAQATTGTTVDATAAFSGAALADGQVTIVVTPTAATAGAGTLTIDVPTQGLAELAAFAGAGDADLAVGAPTVIVMPTAAFSGAGGVGLAGEGEISASAAFTGTGMDDGQVTVTIETEAGFTGEAVTAIVGTDILYQSATFFSGTGTAMTTTGTATLRHTAPGLAVIDRHPPNEIARAR